jgi:quercetin dioxygenase-like cupin family protein
MMTDQAFSPHALETLRALYPEHAGRIAHKLAGHPMFELDALVGLAGRIRPVDAEYNRGDLPVGIDPAATPSNGLSAEETIRSIEECGSWMVLKFVEQDPAYRDLLHSVLAEIEPVVRPLTGEMLKKEAFIFISSPGAVTPFHFDPEHNILLQLRGTKTMTVFPAGDDSIASGVSHETFHNGGHRNLPWNDDFAPRGQAVALSPGEAVYVPVKAPHWVKNGPEVSISFSITWRSDWSYREADARGMNRLLRKAGLDPAPPRRYPAQNLAKSVAYRGIMKARRALKAD